MSEYLELPLASIEVGAGRARDLDPAWIEGLAGSIQEQGLLQPIVVRKIGVGYRLVAGHHRLEAYRHLGYVQIAAVLLDVEADDADSEDAARLAEIMENLGRYELIALDRCQHLFELKHIWERMHPETRAGVAGGKARQGSANEVFSFAAATAEKIGLSQRSIQIAVRIWAGLYPAVRARLRTTKLASKQTELKALSELSIAAQIGVLDLIEDEKHPDIQNVADALAHLDGGITSDPLERRFAAVSKTFSALDDDLLDRVIATHEERVIESLKRRNRI